MRKAGFAASRSIRLKRLAARVLVFLLLGAVINVVVGWVSIALWDPLFGTSDQIRAAGEWTHWRMVSTRSWGAALCAADMNVRRQPGDWPGGADDAASPVVQDHPGWRRSPIPSWVDWRERDTLYPENGPVAGDPCLFLGCGWPFISLACATRVESGKWKGALAVEIPRTRLGGGTLFLPCTRDDSGITRVYRSRVRPIPCKPVWSGFLINTSFYAGSCWFFATAPGAVRRAIRRRRHLCPSCAYPIGTSTVCTECGAPLPPAAREPF
jgi:hypothetical protein